MDPKMTNRCGAPMLRQLAVAPVLLALTVALGACAPDGGQQTDQDAAHSVPDGASEAPASNSGQGDGPESIEPALPDRTGGSPEFAEAYGFDESYLIDVEALQGIIEMEEPADKPMKYGIIGVPATVAEDYQIIDLRTMAKHSKGFIPGSVSIPGGVQFEIRIDEVELDKSIVLISDDGYRLVSGAIQVLLDHGVAAGKISVLEGGVTAWEAAGLPLNSVIAISC